MRMSVLGGADARLVVAGSFLVLYEAQPANPVLPTSLLCWCALAPLLPAVSTLSALAAIPLLTRLLLGAAVHASVPALVFSTVQVGAGLLRMCKLSAEQRQRGLRLPPWPAGPCWAWA